MTTLPAGILRLIVDYAKKAGGKTLELAAVNRPSAKSPPRLPGCKLPGWICRFYAAKMP